MKQESAKEIINILEHYSVLFSDSKKSTQILIGDMQEFVDWKGQVREFITECASKLDYEITDKNNRSRADELVNKRQVIVYTTKKRFRIKKIDELIADVLGKRRSNIIQMTTKVNDYIASNDAVIMALIDKLQKDN